MTMTSKERVNAAIDFDCPDRLPRDLWGERIIPLTRASDWQKVLSQWPMDFARAVLSFGASEKAKGLPWEEGGQVDEWGNLWVSAEEGLKGEVVKGALSGWEGFDSYEPPYELLEGFGVEFVNNFCQDNSEKFVLGEVGLGPFERAQSLLGTEELLMSIGIGDERLSELLKRVHNWNITFIKKLCQTDVDGITMGDDWGSQTAMLASPVMWREVFKPLYSEYVDVIHSANKRFFFHSDGWIKDIIPDLAEIGIDALNCQLFCMDIDDIGANFKGKITFWGEIDRQEVLPFGSVEDVRQACRKFKSCFYDRRGGLIAQLAWSPNDPLENILAAFAEWNKK